MENKKEKTLLSLLRFLRRDAIHFITRKRSKSFSRMEEGEKNLEDVLPSVRQLCRISETHTDALKRLSKLAYQLGIDPNANDSKEFLCNAILEKLRNRKLKELSSDVQETIASVMMSPAKIIEYIKTSKDYLVLFATKGIQEKLEDSSDWKKFISDRVRSTFGQENEKALYYLTQLLEYRYPCDVRFPVKPFKLILDIRNLFPLEYETSAFELAIFADNASLFHVLVRSPNINVNQILFPGTAIVTGALMYMAHTREEHSAPRQHVDVLKLLLDRSDYDPNKDPNMSSSFFIKQLMENRFNIEVQEMLDILVLLAKHYADANKLFVVYYVCKVREWNWEYDRATVAEAVIDNLHLDVNFKTNTGYTMLNIAESDVQKAIREERFADAEKINAVANVLKKRMGLAKQSSLGSEPEVM